MEEHIEETTEEEEPEKLTRQQRRQNARLDAKAIATHVRKKIKGASRQERRSVAFDVTKKQLAEGIRKGTEYKPENNIDEPSSDIVEGTPGPRGEDKNESQSENADTSTEPTSE